MDPLTRRQLLARSAGAVFVLTTGGLGLSACAAEEPEPAGEEPLRRLSVMMPAALTMSYIADVAAASGGFLRDNGIELDLQFARSSIQPIQQLVAGQVHLVRASALLMVRAMEKSKAPLISIATPAQEIIFGVVSAKSDPVRSLADLAGATVGLTTLGGGAEQTLDIVLRGSGVDPKTVKRLPTGNQASAFTFVQQKKVQALFTSPEAVSGILLAAPGEAEVLSLEGINPLLGNALVTTQDLLEEREDDLVRYLRGLRSAMLAVHDPAEFEALSPQIRKDWDLPALDRKESAAAAAAATAELWFAAGEDNLLRNVEERWEKGIASFMELGLVPPGTDPASLYTNRLVEQATR